MCSTTLLMVEMYGLCAVLELINAVAVLDGNKLTTVMNK